jgi:uncharacterized repeat protein (TIGR01451 family)
MTNYFKRTVFILLINISLAFNTIAQNIPNGGFEDWTFFPIDTSVICPHYWDADFHVTPIKSTDAHSGQFALKVTIADLNPIFNSRVVLDSDTILDNYYRGEGMLFPYRPTHLRYWIKYDTKGNDSICVDLALKKWDYINNQSILIGSLKSGFKGYSNQYIEVVKPITYHSAITPDSLFVTIYTKGTDTASYGIIDDIHLAYGAILGKVFFDVDSNGIQDVNEVGVPNQVIRLDPDSIFTITDNNGNYKFFPTDTGNFSINYSTTNPWGLSGNSVSPRQVYLSKDSTIDNIDFSVKPTGIFSDLLIDIDAAPFRHSRYSIIFLTYKNQGTIIENGTINLILDSLHAFVNSVPPSTNVSGNQITWNYSNLDLFERRRIELIVSNPNSSFLGHQLLTTASISSQTSAMFFDSLSRPLLASYDPNDKLVSPGIGAEGYVLHGTRLEYTIRFQNTGNDTAINVSILDNLDPHLNPQTFNLIGSSHAMNPSIKGQNVLVFEFNNIMLPDSNVDEAASHGFVKYSIEPYANLPEATVAENTAHIYFDYNPPITTNTTISTFVSVIQGVNEKGSSNYFLLYPNPTNTHLNITASIPQNQPIHYQIISTLGMAVMAGSSNETAFSADVSKLPSGIYFITLQSEDAKTVKRFLKE